MTFRAPPQARDPGYARSASELMRSPSERSEELDALEYLIRSDVPHPFRRACMSRYLYLTEPVGSS